MAFTIKQKTLVFYVLAWKTRNYTEETKQKDLLKFQPTLIGTKVISAITNVSPNYAVFNKTKDHCFRFGGIESSVLHRTNKTERSIKEPSNIDRC